MKSAPALAAAVGISLETARLVLNALAIAGFLKTRTADTDAVEYTVAGTLLPVGDQAAHLRAAPLARELAARAADGRLDAWVTLQEIMDAHGATLTVAWVARLALRLRGVLPRDGTDTELTPTS